MRQAAFKPVAQFNELRDKLVEELNCDDGVEVVETDVDELARLVNHWLSSPRPTTKLYVPTAEFFAQLMPSHKSVARLTKAINDVRSKRFDKMRAAAKKRGQAPPLESVVAENEVRQCKTLAEFVELVNRNNVTFDKQHWSEIASFYSLDKTKFVAAMRALLPDVSTSVWEGVARLCDGSKWYTYLAVKANGVKHGDGALLRKRVGNEKEETESVILV